MWSQWERGQEALRECILTMFLPVTVFLWKVILPQVKQLEIWYNKLWIRVALRVAERIKGS